MENKWSKVKNIGKCPKFKFRKIFPLCNRFFKKGSAERGVGSRDSAAEIIVQKVDWMNRILEMMWPYISEFAEQKLYSFEDKLRDKLPSALSSFKFTRIDFGDTPPQVEQFKVYSELRRGEIYIDLDIKYNSNAKIVAVIHGYDAGIKDLRILGTLRVVLKPLMNRVPLVGGLLVYFLNNPEVYFDLTGLSNVFSLPVLSNLFDSIITEQIAKHMVLPNRFPIKLSQSLDINRLKYPPPEGVVRITVVRAENLSKVDTSIIVKNDMHTGYNSIGKLCQSINFIGSDPLSIAGESLSRKKKPGGLYVLVKLGAASERTNTVKNSINPAWNETLEMAVDESHGQLLFLDVLRNVTGAKDELLGKVIIDVSTIREEGFQDEWFPLGNAKSGKVHLKLTWLWLANDPLELDKIISNVPEGMHSAVVMCFLDRAFHLPRDRYWKLFKYIWQDPSIQCVINVGHTTMESKIQPDNTMPCWEQNFRFLVINPYIQTLNLEMNDTKTGKLIGTTFIPLKDLLSANNMEMDQKFMVTTSQRGSFVIMRLCLRILTPHASHLWLQKCGNQRYTKMWSLSHSVDSDPNMLLLR